MYKLLSMSLMSVLIAFAPATEPVTTIGNVKELSGYQLRDKVISIHDYNLWVIANEETFDNVFVAQYDSVARPNFEKELVLAAKVETWNNVYKVKFKTILVKDESLNVYFSIQRDKNAMLGIGAPVYISVFPKSSTVKKVNFYHDNVLVRTVPIVSVY
jgi:hypothetical protein